MIYIKVAMRSKFSARTLLPVSIYSFCLEGYFGVNRKEQISNALYLISILHTVYLSSFIILIHVFFDLTFKNKKILYIIYLIPLIFNYMYYYRIIGTRVISKEIELMESKNLIPKRISVLKYFVFAIFFLVFSWLLSLEYH